MVCSVLDEYVREQTLYDSYTCPYKGTVNIFLSHQQTAGPNAVTQLDGLCDTSDEDEDDDDDDDDDDDGDDDNDDDNGDDENEENEGGAEEVSIQFAISLFLGQMSVYWNVGVLFLNVVH